MYFIIHQVDSLAKARRLLLATSIGAITASIGFSPAFAQEMQESVETQNQAETGQALNDTAVFDDIVVTAERRNTSLQKTPIAVTALSGAIIAEKQIYGLRDLQSLVPSFRAGDNQGVAQFTVRGIGSSAVVTGSEGPVAVNLNEVYISRPVAQLAGLYDVSAIEVLRGPQGTLYGRNATAASINITTARPTGDLEGFLRLTVGNYGALRLEGAVGGAIINDKLLVRTSGFRETRNGYGVNVVTGSQIDDKDAYGLRGTLIFQPSDGIKATLIGEYYNQADNSGGLHYFGAAGLTGLPGALGSPPHFPDCWGVYL